MLLVPYSDNPLGNPNEKYLLDLDDEMERVLKNKNISKDEKIKLYTQTLAQFKEKYNPEDYDNNKLTNAVSELVQTIKQPNQTLENSANGQFSQSYSEDPYYYKNPLDFSSVKKSIKEPATRHMNKILTGPTPGAQFFRTINQITDRRRSTQPLPIPDINLEESNYTNENVNHTQLSPESYNHEKSLASTKSPQYSTPAKTKLNVDKITDLLRSHDLSKSTNTSQALKREFEERQLADGDNKQPKKVRVKPVYARDKVPNLRNKKEHKARYAKEAEEQANKAIAYNAAQTGTGIWSTRNFFS